MIPGSFERPASCDPFYARDESLNPPLEDLRRPASCCPPSSQLQHKPLSGVRLRASGTRRTSHTSKMSVLPRLPVRARTTYDVKLKHFTSPVPFSSKRQGTLVVKHERDCLAIGVVCASKFFTPRQLARHPGFRRVDKVEVLEERVSVVCGTHSWEELNPCTIAFRSPLMPSTKKCEKVVKSVLLSSYLPYNPGVKRGAELKKGLNQLLFLYLVLDKSVRAFIEKDFEAFDALVGENACQIRAVMIVLIARETLGSSNSLFELQMQVQLAYKRVEGLLGSIDGLMRSRVTLAEVMLGNELDVQLSNEENIIFTAHLLTIAKSHRISDPGELRRITVGHRRGLSATGTSVEAKALSVKFTGSIVRKARFDLSEASARFVQCRARQSGIAQNIEMTRGVYELRHNSWPVIPMYWTYSTLVQTIRDERIPVLFRAIFLASGEREELFFAPKHGGPEFEYAPFIDFKYLHQPAIIVEGVVNHTFAESVSGAPLKLKEWKDLMVARNLEVILAGAADHRQYPSERMEEVLAGVEDPEFSRHKEMALRDGFSWRNPTGFFMRHVFTALPVNLQPQAL